MKLFFILAISNMLFLGCKNTIVKKSQEKPAETKHAQKKKFRIN
jgi:hypothetical protein